MVDTVEKVSAWVAFLALNGPGETGRTRWYVEKFLLNSDRDLDDVAELAADSLAGKNLLSGNVHENLFNELSSVEDGLPRCICIHRLDVAGDARVCKTCT